MEILSIYDDSGNLTSKRIVRGSKINLEDNEHIACSVIFIENDEGKFLIQKTSLAKGGEFSTTGGHILEGETPIDAIIRETQEEIGLELKKEEIIDLGYILYDAPIRFMFYAKKNVDLSKLKLQEEEVESVSYMSREEINEIIDAGYITRSHGIIFDEVMNKLGK